MPECSDLMHEESRSRLTHPRYSRQVLFDGIKDEGQARISASRVALVGCGALGAAQASLLVRAGVGTLRIIDRDFVDESNLQRQILFDEEDVCAVLPKAVAAEKKLRKANSLVNVEGVVEDVNASSIDRLLGGFDLIMDASDNFEVRYLINDFSVKNKIPWIYGACVASYGLTFPILPGDGPCLRCVFKYKARAGGSHSCDTAGVIGPIVLMIAGMQAAEAMKILSGAYGSLCRKITSVDLWGNIHTSVDLPPRNPECPCCAHNEFSFWDGLLGSEVTTLCGRNSVQIRRREDAPINMDLLARKLAPVGELERNRFLLRAAIDGCQLTIFPDGRTIISGARDIGAAKSLYARYVGN